MRLYGSENYRLHVLVVKYEPQQVEPSLLVVVLVVVIIYRPAERLPAKTESGGEPQMQAKHLVEQFDEL